MSTHDPQKQLRYLLDEIEALGGARHLSYVMQDATGLFVPGFAALPAVTIMGNDSWRTKAMPGPEHWRTGDLIALTAEGDAGENARLQRVFFTPVCDVTIPMVDVSPAERPSRLSSSFRLAPNERWTGQTMQFAVLPWDTGEGTDSKWNSDDISAIAEAFDTFKLNLKITADVAGQAVELVPDWGPSPALPPPVVDGARFPLNHARQLLAPFLFRITFEPALQDPNGNDVALETQPVTLHIQFDEPAYARLFGQAGLAPPRGAGVTVVANAFPVANLDLKAWPAGDKFADFVRETGMSPLGTAGIFHFKRVGEQSRVDPLQSHANVFSVEIDRDGGVLNRYALPGEKDVVKDKQLLMWMSLGSEANGARFQYKPQSIRQPMEKSSQMLVNARSVVPSYGGAECFPRGGADLHGNLMLNVSAVPQMFAFREGLTRAAQDVISSLGYDRVSVAAVEPELRVVGTVRRRVTVVTLDNRGREAISARHLRALQSYLTERSPLGAEVIVEENADRDPT